MQQPGFLVIGNAAEQLSQSTRVWLRIPEYYSQLKHYLTKYKSI